MTGIIAMILAGGRGRRLHPLTRDRAKPAVPFGGAYRIIDFTISNCINSRIRKIFVLTQYKSLSLERHIQRAWGSMNSRFDEFVNTIHAQQRVNDNWYRGTADAVFQNFYTLQEERPTEVLVLAGDHVYCMDYHAMINQHRASAASLTIGAVEHPRSDAHQFGVLTVDAESRVTAFAEKPAQPAALPDRPDTALINMGIYVFSTDTLVARLIEDARNPASTHDFGADIIPAMLDRDDVRAFRFIDRDGNPGYWRDVGTIDAYYQCHQDLLRPQAAQSLYRPDWPIYTSEKIAQPARIRGFARDGDTLFGTAVDCILSRGCLIDGAAIRRSILSPHVTVGARSTVEDAILLDGVRVGRDCQLRRVIVDKQVAIPDNTRIGHDLEADRRHYTVSPDGVRVIPRNTTF